MRRRPVLLLAAKLGLALAVVLGGTEVALHLFPRLVPSTFRRSFPLFGVGFFQPRLLDETPLEAMPLPLYVGTYEGPPPADLVEYGVAPPAAAEADRSRYPRVRVQVDAMGLPNPSIPAQADWVLVGDSFLVSGGVAEPPGLVRQLAAATGETVYDLGVSGIGPFQERDLLQRLGLPKHPSIVVWFFFGGNDLTDALMTLYQEHRGLKTWGDMHADHRPPRLLLPAILRFYLGRARDEAGRPSLPGARLPRPDGGETAIWFHPNYLLAALRSRQEWEADPSWAPTVELLRGVRDEVRAAGAKLLFVYLPSKTQTYLPHVEPDADLLWKMLNYRREETLSSAEAFLPQALANRGSLEALLADTCAQEGIAFLSASPSLDAVAARGELAYLVADTHWDIGGQEAFLPVLRDALASMR